MFHSAVKGTIPLVNEFRGDAVRFLRVVNDASRWPNEHTGAGGVRRVTLKAVCGPGDEGEPVVTLMMPEED